jgi:hypothetical protein
MNSTERPAGRIMACASQTLATTLRKECDSDDASPLNIASSGSAFGVCGGRTGARTWDPLIKRLEVSEQNQKVKSVKSVKALRETNDLARLYQNVSPPHLVVCNHLHSGNAIASAKVNCRRTKWREKQQVS